MEKHIKDDENQLYLNKNSLSSSIWKPRSTEEILKYIEFNKLFRCKLSWGIDQIDTALGGGLLSGLIYEISGEAGSGKTQAALTLTSQVLISNASNSIKNGYVYYICTYGNFPVTRLRQILETRLARHASNDLKNINLGTETLRNLLDRVFIETIYTNDELWDVFNTKIPKLLKNFEIRLIVIDSITQLYRFTEEPQESLSTRSCIFFALSSILKRIASENQLWILIINEVSDIIGQKSSERINMNNQLQPSLGLAWANCIDTRIFLSRSIETKLHKLDIHFSPNAPPCYNEIFFRIGKSGIEPVLNE